MVGIVAGRRSPSRGDSVRLRSSSAPTRRYRYRSTRLARLLSNIAAGICYRPLISVQQHHRIGVTGSAPVKQSINAAAVIRSRAGRLDNIDLQWYRDKMLDRVACLLRRVGVAGRRLHGSHAGGPQEYMP